MNPRRRRLWIGIAAIAALVGGDYVLGLRQDSVELRLRGVAAGRATLTACGATVPFASAVPGLSALRATPPRLCNGPATVQLLLDGGSIRRCTALNLSPGQDYQVVIAEQGCGGFEPTALPAFP